MYVHIVRHGATTFAPVIRYSDYSSTLRSEVSGISLCHGNNKADGPKFEALKTESGMGLLAGAASPRPTT